jgi:ribonucleoside-diphosphate reductase alpha chain
MAHVRMLAATQPFLSGAISKTINMPAEATIDEVRGVYDAAATLGVKALALYRDGSKLSQPLSGALADVLDEDEEEALEAAVEAVSAATGTGTAEHPAVVEAERIIRSMPRPQLERWLALLAEDAIGLGRGREERLPARRRGYAQKAKVGGHTIYLHTGDFETPDASGRPRLGEIFVSMSKDGAAFRSLMNCFAIAVSIGLQRGVPLEDYVDSFTFTKFEPNGLVTGHDRISMATSIIDYVFRDLAVNYLGRDDLAHFGPVDLSTDSTAEDEAEVETLEALPRPSLVVAEPVVVAGDASAPVAVATPVAATPAPAAEARAVAYVAASDVTSVRSRREFAKQAGFEGDPCAECGQMMMVRNGTCLKCMNCGATSGCS